MIYISHRGFVNGKDKSLENNPNQIKHLTEQDINVEVDVRFYKNKFYLGHDEPVYEINKSFLTNNKLWCHAKNFLALENMLDNNIHCFFHNTDHYTLTSKNYIWAYPGIDGGKMTIAVKPEGKNLDLTKFSGICSDQIDKYK